MRFASDNWAGASERVIEAVARAARDGGPAYGGDPLTASIEARLAEIFEREVAVFLVGTGTAANALALSSYSRAGGAVLCHRDAHIATDEAGATEFFSGGMKTVAIDGPAGKITPDGLAAALARYPERDVHHGQVVALSLTQRTEMGTAYTPADVALLAAAAKRRGAAVHMDGARFANAAASLGASPAEMTWKAGVDVLSLGGTKNGCMAAEAVVFFEPTHARDFGYARQRAGQGFSKAWFIAAQLDAYLDGGHWLDNARHANAMAGKVADAIRRSAGSTLAWEPAGNEVFAVIPRAVDDRLRADGASFYPWSVDVLSPDLRPGPDHIFVRLVTSWQTTADEVALFAAILSDR